MNADPIARIYQIGERLVFGHQLERCRNEYLSELKNCKHALLLGDGDGRFLCSLLKESPDVEIDYVELSHNMIDQARLRLGQLEAEARKRVRFYQADIFEIALPAHRFDLVCSHFLLDCLTTEETRRLAYLMRQATGSQTLWVVSDFQLPSGKWRRLHAKIWLRFLYLLFRVTTGLRTRKIPAYPASLRAAGFVLLKSHERFAGMLTAQLWTKREILPEAVNFTGPTQ